MSAKQRKKLGPKRPDRHQRHDAAKPCGGRLVGLRRTRPHPTHCPTAGCRLKPELQQPTHQVYPVYQPEKPPFNERKMISDNSLRRRPVHAPRTANLRGGACGGLVRGVPAAGLAGKGGDPLLVRPKFLLGIEQDGIELPVHRRVLRHGGKPREVLGGARRCRCSTRRPAAWRSARPPSADAAIGFHTSRASSADDETSPRRGGVRSASGRRTPSAVRA